MTAKQLFQAGQLTEAVRALTAEVRDNPADAQRRTFLFELLCLSGDYDRAEKQLGVLSAGNSNVEMGAVLYYSALHGMKTRRELFDKKAFPVDSAPDRDFAGTVNGTAFEWIADGDPRIGSRLELFAAGAYLWISFEHIVSIELEAPKRLRDLLWAPALVRTGPDFKDKELGEVMIPVLYPGSEHHASDAVKLGRETHWIENGEDDPLPKGQKVFLIDGEEFPLLEVRKIEFTHAQAASQSGSD